MEYQAFGLGEEIVERTTYPDGTVVERVVRRDLGAVQAADSAALPAPDPHQIPEHIVANLTPHPAPSMSLIWWVFPSQALIGPLQTPAPVVVAEMLRPLHTCHPSEAYGGANWCRFRTNIWHAAGWLPAKMAIDVILSPAGWPHLAILRIGQIGGTMSEVAIRDSVRQLAAAVCDRVAPALALQPPL